MTAPKLVIVISGGNLQEIHCTAGFPEIDLVVIDHDNMEAEGISAAEADAIQDRATADTPNVHGWDDHKDYM